MSECGYQSRDELLTAVVNFLQKGGEAMQQDCLWKLLQVSDNRTLCEILAMRGPLTFATALQDLQEVAPDEDLLEPMSLVTLNMMLQSFPRLRNAMETYFVDARANGVPIEGPFPFTFDVRTMRQALSADRDLQQLYQANFSDAAISNYISPVFAMQNYDMLFWEHFYENDTPDLQPMADFLNSQPLYRQVQVMKMCPIPALIGRLRLQNETQLQLAALNGDAQAILHMQSPNLEALRFVAQAQPLLLCQLLDRGQAVPQVVMRLAMQEHPDLIYEDNCFQTDEITMPVRSMKRSRMG